MELRGYLSNASTPAVWRELEVQGTGGAIRLICGECGNLSACMNTTIGSSCELEPGFAPV